jgi:arylsulfatase A-like enzyme
VEQAGIHPRLGRYVVYVAPTATFDISIRSSSATLILTFIRGAAAYYGMIEDTDTWVGELMKTLKARGQWENTMVVFTSDHGEMLGAHGFGGKQVLLEEAIRIPLIMKLPAGAANRVRRVDVPVSHLDIFSTVLDYLGAPENLSYNERWDEEIVVCEYDERNPNSTTKLTGVFGSAPGFSIRKGQFKLILPRKATSTVIDMMYDLRTDPYVAIL